MALMRVDDYESQESSSGIIRSCFWDLRINADCGSKKASKELENGTRLVGYQEDGWFLGKLKHMLIVSIHRHIKTDDLILCNRSFGEDKECPICDLYQHAKKDSGYNAMNQMAMLPFLATRRQNDPQISVGRKTAKQIIPIYWFTMNVTHYRDDYKQNWLRLRDANENRPIHKYPYRIFAQKRGEREIQNYHFSALKEKPEHEITFDHPIIDDWLDEKGNWVWDKDYMELLTSLAISRYKPFVDPSTKEVFDYDGEYDRAIEMFESTVESYGSPSETLEDYEPQDEDDDELQ